MIYLLFVAIWPLINYLGANFHKLGANKEIGVITFALVIPTILCTLIFKKVTKSSTERLILPAFAAIALVFGYGKIVDAIGPHAFFNYIKLSYIYLLVFVGLIYVLWRISLSDGIQKIAKILVSVVFAASIVNLTTSIYTHLNQTSLTKQSDQDIKSGDDKTESQSFAFKRKPNVYYILVDAYARQDTLMEITGYDNEPFLSQLENKGFIVSKEARSNYHFTVASLSATMNMDYHPYDNQVYSYVDMQRSLRGINKVRNTFRQNGYEIINMPAHWQEVGCFGNEDVCIRGNNFEIYESFLSDTPLRTLKFPNDYAELESVNLSYGKVANSPKFIFVHIAQVHDAVFDENGHFQSALHPCFSGKEDSARYVSSIKTMNQKLLKFIEATRSKDPSSIIIIQADHGPTYIGCLEPPDPNYWVKNSDDIRLKTQKDIRYTFGVFSAVYVPKNEEVAYKNLKQYFSGSYSLVNTFRYIFAYLSGSSPALLPDKSHFLYYDQSIKAYREDDINNLAK
jgi:hypothetical protein